MRLLFLTNFYPPHGLGGMELSCQAAVDGLRGRGHAALVLTSTHGVRRPRVEGHVARLLRLEMTFAKLHNAWQFFIVRQRHESYNCRVLHEQITRFEPDLVFVWGMWNLSRTLAAYAESLMQGRVLYRFADYWPALPSQVVLYWREPGRYTITRAVKRPLASLALRSLKGHQPVELGFPHCVCVSQAVRRQLLLLSVPVARAPVIDPGYDLSPFRVHRVCDKWRAVTPCDVLYVGRLKPEKGAHVLVEALGYLAARRNGTAWKLTIAGQGDTAYMAKLRRTIESRGIRAQVDWLGHLPPGRIPALMHRHGTLVVPSLWADPLPRVAVEGMAAGCVVVASEIGGLPEIIDHGQTGWLVAPGDARALAEALSMLASKPELAASLAARGQARAAERFDLERMLDQLEPLLASVGAH